MESTSTAAVMDLATTTTARSATDAKWATTARLMLEQDRKRNRSRGLSGATDVPDSKIAKDATEESDPDFITPTRDHRARRGHDTRHDHATTSKHQQKMKQSDAEGKRIGGMHGWLERQPTSARPVERLQTLDDLPFAIGVDDPEGRETRSTAKDRAKATRHTTATTNNRTRTGIRGTSAPPSLDRTRLLQNFNDERLHQLVGNDGTDGYRPPTLQHWRTKQQVLDDLGLSTTHTPANGHCQQYAVAEGLLRKAVLDMQSKGPARARFHQLVRYLRRHMQHEYETDIDRETAETSLTGKDQHLEGHISTDDKKVLLSKFYRSLADESTALDSKLPQPL